MLFTSCSVFCFQPGHIIAGKPLLPSTLEQLNPITQVWGYYYYYSPVLSRRCSHTLPLALVGKIIWLSMMAIWAGEEIPHLDIAANLITILNGSIKANFFP